VTTSLLIDTHILLWIRRSPQVLTAGERNILDATLTVWVSPVTIWEIAILLGLGRLPGGNDQLLSVPAGLNGLPITVAHCKALAALPRLHGDPFDRMLIAQAQSENLPLLTRDRAMQAYRQYATILP
jgi:PIN domain nuclease of toxin-antitoxin system